MAKEFRVYGVRSRAYCEAPMSTSRSAPQLEGRIDRVGASGLIRTVGLERPVQGLGLRAGFRA